MIPSSDIGIVGAGPAGATAAISLARRGYSVCLVDKAVFPRHKLCGDFLNPINWPLLAWLGIAEHVLTLPHEKISGFRISTAAGREAFFPFPTQAEGQGFGLGVSRLEFDHLLVRRAQTAGVKVLQGTRIKELKRENGHWFLTLMEPDGEKTIRAAFLIGADGRNSWVARHLGVASHSEGETEFIGLRLRLGEANGLKGEVQIHLFPGGYAGLVGIGGGTVNLCLTLDAHELKHNGPAGVILWDRLRQNPQLKRALGADPLAGEIHSIYPVRYPRRRPFGDGFLLIGDAAFAPEPVTGEGVYFALSSGELGAGTVHQGFVKGDLSAHQTASYEAAWRRRTAGRRRTNRLIRTLVNHPLWIGPLIGLSNRTAFPIRPLIRSVLNNSSQPTHMTEKHEDVPSPPPWP